MRWPAVVLAVMLPGCAFEVPREPNARELCYQYADEVTRKAEECGDPPEQVAFARARNLAKCDRVVLINPLVSVERCINEIRRFDCAARAGATWCPAFVEGQ